MLKSIKLLKDAYIAGFMHRVYKAPAISKPSASKAMKKHSSPAAGSAVTGYYGWNHVLFEQQSNGSWTKDNIIIVVDGGTTTSFTVTIDWNEEAVKDDGDKYIVCHVPHLPALTILLGFLYPSKIAKFTSLVDGLRPNH
jgi:hypothetical protein